MNRCLKETDTPEWITKGKTILIQKDPRKGIAPNKYRPIMCLPILWKILMVQIKEIYNSLISRRLLPEEQKGSHKGTRETRELLYIDQHIFKESKNETYKSSYGVD